MSDIDNLRAQLVQISWEKWREGAEERREAYEQAVQEAAERRERERQERQHAIAKQERSYRWAIRFWIPLCAIFAGLYGDVGIFAIIAVPYLIWALIRAIYRIRKAFLKFYRPIQAKRDAKWVARRRKELGYDK